tara:strand:- start:83 stop:346 length:264 start_codon:yes stop_codon:yes gene_type:complete
MINKQNFSKLVFFIISSVLINEFFIFAYAELKSKSTSTSTSTSQEFLKIFCLEFLNAIKDDCEIPKISFTKNDFKELHKEGNLIGVL